MKPDSVGQVSGELAIVAREPVGELDRGRLRRRPPGTGRPRRGLGASISRVGAGSFRAGLKIDELVAVDLVLVEVVAADVVQLLARDVGEARGQSVVVVLGPVVEGMVVAPGALEPDAEEDLGRRSRRPSSGRGWSGGSSTAGLVQVEPREATIRRTIWSSGTSAASGRGASAGRPRPPSTPIVFSSLRSRSAHLSPEIGELGAVEQPSISLARLAGSRSARNARVSSGVGSRPMASR